jgi:type IV pilus biogenesis protein CpaD/CtpE
MASKAWALPGVVIALALALNLAGCAQTGTTQTGTVPQGGAYQQEQKMLWSTDPQGSGQSTDWDVYMDEEGGGR